jgi:hypothetical protein
VAIIATAGDSKTYTPAPAGSHQAVCVDVVDKGLLEVTYAGKTKKQHKVSLAWQIEELRDDGKRFTVYKRYTLSLNEKATLRHDLESWRGKPFTDAELAGFDVESVIGANCLISVQQKQVQDRTYANVTAVMALPKGMPKLQAVDYVREKDRVDDEAGGDSHSEPLNADDIPF